MGILYSCAGGGRKDNSSKINARDKAVLDLKTQRDKLKQMQTQINKVIEREIAIAKECSRAGKKKQAILALKKKKYQEKLLDDSFKNLSNIEELITNIEEAEVQVKILECLKNGNSALKEIQKEMTLEKVEDIMAETQEAIQYQQDIQDALNGKFTAEEEDDLLAELDEMEKEILEKDFPKVPDNQLKINVPIDHILESEGKLTEKLKEKRPEKEEPQAELAI
ncbi:SNF7 family protein [Tieghemostelium lacteum]|uniref:SNF7 family protein n=1 Tax=Tieghemostelium lacteum TaxID=361077 RepID=A0A152A6W8_TIELA|nr:SNF7 family protein [Tieghemostelium lacteum]|eukprot:KYR01960.1 SNF7 family protein [Tieghemostelium lacteum]